MTNPLRLPEPLKQLARILRDSPTTNRLISSAARKLPASDVRSRLIARIPRVGKITTRLPDGKILTMECAASESVTASVFYDGWKGQEPEVLPIWRALAERAEHILDIGAHVGHFSLVAGLTNPAAKLYCFEPLPKVAKILRRNLELNSLKPAVHELALNTSVGHLTFYSVPDGIPSSSSLSKSFMSDEHGTELDEVTVATSTLDALFPSLTGAVLLKIDTETTEPQVFAGGLEFIRRTKPIIIVEVLAKHETGPDLHDILERAGYAFTPYLMTDAGLQKASSIRGNDRWRNFLLVPNDGPFATPEMQSFFANHLIV